MVDPKFIRRLRILSVVAIFLGTGSAVIADPILPGNDNFWTKPGTFVIVDILGQPLQIDFAGNPRIVDTVVHRDAGCTTLPCTIPIEIIELSLTSSSPVNIGGTFFDVFATIDPAVDQNTGSMTITGILNVGGTFESTLPVDALLRFTEVGNPSNTVEQSLRHIDLNGSGFWADRGRTHFRVIHDPITDAPLRECDTIPPDCEGARVVHIVNQVPEPGALLLLSAGLGLYMVRRRFL